MPSFFRTLELRTRDVARFPDAVRRMRREEFEGIILTDVYDARDCTRICERLEAGRHGLMRSDFPPLMSAYFLGMNLNLTEPDLASYFRAAPLFRAALAQVFADSIDFEARLSELLSAIDAGRPYRAAPGPSAGLDYMFTTLRAHLPGGFIPPHFDNEQRLRASYRQLLPQIGDDLYSFVLGLQPADAGGALEIFNLRHGGQPYRMADGAEDASHIDLEGVESVSFPLKPGAMILFNSGRYLHRVTPVQGQRIRWTACSFIAESRAGEQAYCWG
jgi:hypothetical protein